MEGRERIVIESVTPQIDCGRYPVKRVVGDELSVEADIFSDGHDEVAAVLLYRKQGEKAWREIALQRLDNDRWQGAFTLAEPGTYHYTLIGWVDHFLTWQKDLKKRHEAGQDIAVDILIGVALITKAAQQAGNDVAEKLRRAAGALGHAVNRQRAVTIGLDPELAATISACCARGLATRYPQELSVCVDRKKAVFSSWYELFPRSCGAAGKHGTFKDCQALLPEISAMGFDVLYLPPIHPIGFTKRKGKANKPVAQPEDPGSPWAIGADAGGHKAVHPELGTLKDFQELVREAEKRGLEIALDLAYQCSPDHPYLKDHPEWFLWRPDGTVQYAENPPKKYQDIVPFNFETAAWRELWDELKGVLFFWMDLGVRIFRVDNPHTKPFPFWEWLIGEAKKRSPEVIFLAEAFTRPKVMYRLAKVGFSQSYSYFAWRSSKQELISYLEELISGDVPEFLRPNFWPNTPDILTQYLQVGGRPAFMIRLVLAATLSSSYGIYGPPFELCVAGAEPGSEEYLDAEKYEIRSWDREAPDNLKGFIALLNRVRRDNPALQQTNDLTFFATESDDVIFYGKSSSEHSNTILVAVNLDPFHTRQARLQVPLAQLGIAPGRSYLVQDLLSGDNFIWQKEWNSVELDPGRTPARIFRIRTWLRKEADFDYYL
jgi:starch synthase (maltosyl-transferring)